MLLPTNAQELSRKKANKRRNWGENGFLTFEKNSPMIIFHISITSTYLKCSYMLVSIMGHFSFFKVISLEVKVMSRVGARHYFNVTLACWSFLGFVQTFFGQGFLQSCQEKAAGKGEE